MQFRHLIARQLKGDITDLDFDYLVIGDDGATYDPGSGTWTIRPVDENEKDLRNYIEDPANPGEPLKIALTDRTIDYKITWTFSDATTLTNVDPELAYNVQTLGSKIAKAIYIGDSVEFDPSGNPGVYKEITGLDFTIDPNILKLNIMIDELTANGETISEYGVLATYKDSADSRVHEMLSCIYRTQGRPKDSSTTFEFQLRVYV